MSNTSALAQTPGAVAIRADSRTDAPILFTNTDGYMYAMYSGCLAHNLLPPRAGVDHSRLATTFRADASGPELTDRRGLMDAPLKAFCASYTARTRQVPNLVGT